MIQQWSLFLFFFSFLDSFSRRQVLQSRKDSLREGSTTIPQPRKESLKGSNSGLTPVFGASPPRRKDSDKLPGLPVQIDDGYEAVQMPQRPSKPISTLSTPIDNSSSEYFTRPSRPKKPKGSSDATASSNDSTSQQAAPPVRPGRGGSSSSNAYETVEIFPSKRGGKDTSSDSSSTSSLSSSSSSKPPRPPKPGSVSETQDDDSSSIYQEPPAPVSVTPAGDDVYDNVHIRNIPLATNTTGQGTSGPGTFTGTEIPQGILQSTSGLGTFTGTVNEGAVIQNEAPSQSHSVDPKKEEATDGKLELDSGGMGCTNIQKAMEERRQILMETETKEGVVLLSVQKAKEESTDRFEKYGMCVCCLDMHAHPCVIIICTNNSFVRSSVKWSSGGFVNFVTHCDFQSPNPEVSSPRLN